jgi:hypothetical protein
MHAPYPVALVCLTLQALKAYDMETLLKTDTHHGSHGCSGGHIHSGHIHLQLHPAAQTSWHVYPIQNDEE